MPDNAPLSGTTARAPLEMHLTQAFTRAESATARRQIETALEECRLLPPTPLVECIVTHALHAAHGRWVFEELCVRRGEFAGFEVFRCSRSLLGIVPVLET